MRSDAGKRFDKRDWYCTSGHCCGSALYRKRPCHVEFCRGIKNPLGLKADPRSGRDYCGIDVSSDRAEYELWTLWLERCGSCCVCGQ